MAESFDFSKRPFTHDVMEVGLASDRFWSGVAPWMRGPLSAVGGTIRFTEEPAVRTYQRALSALVFLGRSADSLEELPYHAQGVLKRIENGEISPERVADVVKLISGMAFALPSMILGMVVERPGIDGSHINVIPARPDFESVSIDYFIESLAEQAPTVFAESEPMAVFVKRLQAAQAPFSSVAKLDAKVVTHFLSHTQPLDPDEYKAVVFSLIESEVNLNLNLENKDGEMIFMGYVAHLCMGEGIGPMIKFGLDLLRRDQNLGLGFLGKAVKMGYLNETDIEPFEELRFLKEYDHEFWGPNKHRIKAIAGYGLPDLVRHLSESPYLRHHPEAETSVFQGAVGPMSAGHLGLLASLGGSVLVCPNRFHPTKHWVTDTFNTRVNIVAASVGRDPNIVVTGALQPPPGSPVEVTSLYYQQLLASQGIQSRVVRGTDKFTPKGVPTSAGREVHRMRTGRGLIGAARILGASRVDTAVAELSGVMSQVFSSNMGRSEILLPQTMYISSTLCRRLYHDMVREQTTLQTERDPHQREVAENRICQLRKALRALTPRAVWEENLAIYGPAN